MLRKNLLNLIHCKALVRTLLIWVEGTSSAQLDYDLPRVRDQTQETFSCKETQIRCFQELITKNGLQLHRFQASGRVELPARFSDLFPI